MHYASVENVSKSFGVRTLFNNISFHIEEGDKIAFVARNGIGKSTLLKIIAGMEIPDTGSVWVHKDVKVIMLQQDTKFDGQKSIWDNMLTMDNPIIRLIKEYEMLLEENDHDENRISERQPTTFIRHHEARHLSIFKEQRHQHDLWHRE